MLGNTPRPTRGNSTFPLPPAGTKQLEHPQHLPRAEAEIFRLLEGPQASLWRRETRLHHVPGVRPVQMCRGMFLTAWLGRVPSPSHKSCLSPGEASIGWGRNPSLQPSNKLLGKIFTVLLVPGAQYPRPLSALAALDERTATKVQRAAGSQARLQSRSHVWWELESKGESQLP